jgi:hypothetical protein
VVDKFINDYLVGASRLRASQMNELLSVFIARKLRAEQPIVVGTGLGESPFQLPMVKSKYLSASGREALIESLRQAGNDAIGSGIFDNMKAVARSNVAASAEASKNKVKNLIDQLNIQNRKPVYVPRQLQKPAESIGSGMRY